MSYIFGGDSGMRNFVKMKTRLNCDLFEAYRCLTRKDKIEKWGAHFEEDHFEIKTASGVVSAKITQIGNLNESVEAIIWNALIKKSVEGLESEDEIMQECNFIFYRMNCMRKTEYCVEIHLVIEPIGEVLLPESVFLEMGDAILEMIRKRYNKDWIILDSDLNASILRSSF